MDGRVEGTEVELGVLHPTFFTLDHDLLTDLVVLADLPLQETLPAPFARYAYTQPDKYADTRTPDYASDSHRMLLFRHSQHTPNTPNTPTQQNFNKSTT